MPITIAYATTEHEAVAIHHFLCRVAGPFLPGRIDAEKSIAEVWHVVDTQIALTAWDEKGEMVGTMGLIRMDHWWGNVSFLANRWAFAVPRSKAWRPMLTEARTLARELEIECMIASEDRGRLTILNKSKMRGNRHVLRK